MYTFILPRVYILGLKGNKEAAGVKKKNNSTWEYWILYAPNRKLPAICVVTLPIETQQVSEPYSRSRLP